MLLELQFPIKNLKSGGVVFSIKRVTEVSHVDSAKN
jgi:hypothetical protein